MSASHSLSQYRMSVRRRSSRGANQVFRIDGEFDGFSKMQGWLKRIKNNHIPLCEIPDDKESAKKSIKLLKLECDKEQGLIFALFEAGEGGRAAVIRQISDGEEKANMTHKDAAHSPYLVAIRFVNGSRYATVLCHRVGVHSIKGLFEALLQQDPPFESDYVVKLQPDADRKVLKKCIKEGQGTQVIFTNSGRSETTRRGRLQEINGQDVPEGAVFTFGMRKLTRRQVKDIIDKVDSAEAIQDDQSSRTSIRMSDVTGEEVQGLAVVDEVKVKIRMKNGKSRTFNIMTPDSARISHDIEEYLGVVPPSGNPSFQKLIDAAVECFNTL